MIIAIVTEHNQSVRDLTLPIIILLFIHFIQHYSCFILNHALKHDVLEQLENVSLVDCKIEGHLPHPQFFHLEEKGSRVLLNQSPNNILRVTLKRQKPEFCSSQKVKQVREFLNYS